MCDKIHDGKVTKNYSDAKSKILFILKEPNISNSKGEKVFWFKEVYNCKSKNPSDYYNKENCNRVEKAAQTKYYNCIMGIIERLYPNNKDIGIAYININKNGGGSTSDGKGVAEWLTKENKKQKLLNQIKTELNPTKIVVFSCNNNNKLIMKFAEELKNDCNDCNYCVYGADFHPSRYSKDYELNKL